MKRAAAAWERFWFRREPVDTLVLLRRAFAVVVLAWAATLAPDVGTFHGADGLVRGSDAAPLVLAVLVVSALALLAGRRPRVAAALVFGCLAWFDHVNAAVGNSGELLLRLLALVLALAPGGGPGSRAPVWPLRLIQVQVSVMYLSAVAWKVQGDAWLDGTAVFYPLRIAGVAREPLPDWIVTAPAVVHVLTWGTLAVELAIGLLVWSARARRWVLAAGVVLHLSIEATLAPGFFSWAVLVAYLAFVPPERASRLVAATSRWDGRRRGRTPSTATATTAR